MAEQQEYRASANVQGMGQRQGEAIRARYPTAFLKDFGVKAGDDLIIVTQGKQIVGLRVERGGAAKRKKAAQAATKAAKKSAKKTATKATKKGPAKKAAKKGSLTSAAKKVGGKKSGARKTKVRYADAPTE